MPLTKATPEVIDVDKLTVNLKSNTLTDGIRDYVDDTVTTTINSLTGLINAEAGTRSTAITTINTLLNANSTAITTINTLLNANGIGADLSVTNLLQNVSLNDITEVGEYYYSTGVTDYPVGADAGMMKVWRLNANNVGQLVQPVIGSTKSPWHIRLSTGGTWGPWTAFANQDGDSTRKFKALAGTDGDDVATVSQLNTEVSGVIAPKALALFIVSAGGVVTIERSVNVSSITKIAVGKYQVGFINPLLLSPIVELTTIDQTTQGGFGAGGITRKQATWFSSGLNSIVINLRAVTIDNNGSGVVLYTDDAYISLIVY